MLCQQVAIRTARKSDSEAISHIHRTSFEQDGEADLVAALVACPARTVSLVADCSGRLVGHLLLSELRAPLKAVALAPMAVLPDYREMQIGTALVNEAIRRAQKQRYEAMFVLGYNGYYERFGFTPEAADHFQVEWQGPHFMALELAEGALRGKKGPLIYPDPFRSL